MQLSEYILEWLYGFFISTANIYASRVKPDNVKEAKKIILCHRIFHQHHHHHHFGETRRKIILTFN